MKEMKKMRPPINLYFQGIRSRMKEMKKMTIQKNLFFQDKVKSDELDTLKKKLEKRKAQLLRFGEKLDWYETKLEITKFRKQRNEQIKTFLDQSGDGRKIS